MQYDISAKNEDIAKIRARRQYVQEHHEEPLAITAKCIKGNKWSVTVHDKPPSTGDGELTCPKCGKSYKTQRGLDNHTKRCEQ